MPSGRFQAHDDASSLLADGMTPATLDNTHRAFHGCLEKAVQWGLILRNPSDFAVLPKVRHPEKPMLSESQVQRFLLSARDHRLEALFVLALATGARSGELLALRWSDVDLDEGVIHIRKSLKKTATGFELGDTKTLASSNTFWCPANTIITTAIVTISVPTFVSLYDFPMRGNRSCVNAAEHKRI